MTANYYFQHFVLNKNIKALEPKNLKEIILSKDEGKAKDIFFASLKEANLSMFLDMYKFKCEFITDKEMPVLVFYFDDIVNGFQAVAECYAAIIVVGQKIEYYGVEYSFDDCVVLGQMDGNNHSNYGFYSQSNMEEIINRVIAIEKDKLNKNTKGNAPKQNETEQKTNNTNPKPSVDIKTNVNIVNQPANKISKDVEIDVKKQFASQISFIKKLQKLVLVVFTLMLLFTLIFSISVAVAKNNSMPDESKAKTVQISTLNSTTKTYCDYKNNYYFLYQKVDGKIEVYKFSNSPAYSSGSSVAIKGRATSSDIKKYFGNNVVSGKPSTAFALPAVAPVGAVFYLLFVGTIVGLIIIIHNRAEELIFKLNNNETNFKTNRTKYENNDINKSEYNRTEKSLFSQNIIENRKVESLFKYFY